MDDTYPAWSRPARLICAAIVCCAVFTFTPVAAQQSEGSQDRPEAPGRVEVQPVAKDDEIRQRIANILETTRWFAEPETIATRAEAGLQSEAGEIKEQARKSWAPGAGENLLSPSSGDNS